MASNMIFNHLIVTSSHIGVYVTKDGTKKFVSFVKFNVQMQILSLCRITFLF